jgi:hypothetical protein
VKEVWPTRRSFLAGTLVKAISDDCAAVALSGNRLGARVDLPHHPAITVPRDTPGHGRDVSHTGLSPDQDGYLVGWRNVIAWLPQNIAAAGLGAELQAHCLRVAPAQYGPSAHTLTGVSSLPRIVISEWHEQVSEETDQQENKDHEKDESNRIISRNGSSGQPERLARSDSATVDEQNHQEDKQ